MSHLELLLTGPIGASEWNGTWNSPGSAEAVLKVTDLNKGEGVQGNAGDQVCQLAFSKKKKKKAGKKLLLGRNTGSIASIAIARSSHYLPIEMERLSADIKLKVQRYIFIYLFFYLAHC